MPKKYVSKVDAEKFFSNPKNFAYKVKQDGKSSAGEEAKIFTHYLQTS